MIDDMEIVRRIKSIRRRKYYLTKRCEPLTCECGAVIKAASIYMHVKTQKHLSKIKNAKNI